MLQAVVLFGEHGDYRSMLGETHRNHRPTDPSLTGWISAGWMVVSIAYDAALVQPSLIVAFRKDFT
jgi:hypothetical protein